MVLYILSGFNGFKIISLEEEVVGDRIIGVGGREWGGLYLNILYIYMVF